MVTITGSGFTHGARLFLEGSEAPILGHLVNPHSVSFLINEVSNRIVRDVEFYCADGLPKNYDSRIENYTLYMWYYISKIYPRIGSAGGTLLTFDVTNVGPDTDLSETVAKFAYHDKNKRVQWFDFCKDFKLVSYGKVTCQSLSLLETPDEVPWLFYNSIVLYNIDRTRGWTGCRHPAG